VQRPGRGHRSASPRPRSTATHPVDGWCELNRGARQHTGGVSTPTAPPRGPDGWGGLRWARRSRLETAAHPAPRPHPRSVGRCTRPPVPRVVRWAELPGDVLARAGRPRRGPRPVHDETVPAGCHSTGGGPVPNPLRSALDQQGSGLSRTRAHVPFPPIKSAWTAPDRTGDHQDGVQRDHSQVRTHPAATGSSGTGLARSGTAARPATTFGSWPNPATSPTGGAGSGTDCGEDLGPGRAAVASSRERPAHRRIHRHVDTMGLGPRRETYDVDRVRTGALRNARTAMIGRSGVRATDLSP
jgi:hypothetical protein